MTISHNQTFDNRSGLLSFVNCRKNLLYLRHRKLDIYNPKKCKTSHLLVIKSVIIHALCYP